MKSLESADPFELVGVGHPRQIDADTDRLTARCLIEEYALTGFSASEILQLFASPAYSMPHAILARRGSEYIRGLVDEVFGGAR